MGCAITAQAMRWGWALSRLHDEGPADTLTVQVALVDSRGLIEQGDVVGGVGVPAGVLRSDGSMGLAASVALIHGDHPEVRGELSRGVHRERRGGSRHQ